MSATSATGWPYAPDRAEITGDIAALSSLTRSSARSGERESADYVASRLRAAGVLDVWHEGFRYQHTYTLAHAVHTLPALVAAARGGFAGTAVNLLAWASLELEVSGRRQWVRRLLPAGGGVNVLGRIPARSAPRATVVLVAHHDAANTGVVWNPRIVAFGARRRLKRRRFAPFMAPLRTAFVLAAAGSLGTSRAANVARGTGCAVMGLALAVDADVARSPTVPGASDNASGVAVILDLARALARTPLEHVEVLILAPGAEEAGMGGMSSFLAAHRARLAQGNTFVFGLDTLGAGRPILAESEGAMAAHHYLEPDLAIVEEGAAIAGERQPARWRLGAWTDPILAVFAGLPAASLLSIGPGYFPGYHHPTDVPERVQWQSVESCARIAAGTLQAISRCYAS